MLNKFKETTSENYMYVGLNEKMSQFCLALVI